MNDFDKLKINNNLPVAHLQFFPCVAELILFEQLEAISIDVFENFPKQTFRNRATILSSQGILNIIVPVKSNNKEKVLTKDIEISYSEKWNIEAWRTIFSCYGKSPFFIYYADKVKTLLLEQYKYLMDLNLKVFYFLKQALQLKCDIFFTSQYIDRTIDNYRNMFMPKNREEDGKNIKPYYQCFEEKFMFQTNLSSLDLLFNLGNQAGEYLRSATQ